MSQTPVMARTRSAYWLGDRMPMVSDRRSRSAPASATATAYSLRNSISVRPMSSALMLTKQPWSLAILTMS